MSSNPDDLPKFDYVLSSISNITPEFVNQLGCFENVLNSNMKVQYIIDMLAKEDFSANVSYKLSKEQLKLIKTYQLLIQYSQYCTQQMLQKKKIVADLSNQQYEYFSKADEVLKKQKDRIKMFEQRNHDAANNLLNLEFLIKKLKIDKQLLKVNKKSKVNTSETKMQEQINSENEDNAFSEKKDVSSVASRLEVSKTEDSNYCQSFDEGISELSEGEI